MNFIKSFIQLGFILSIVIFMASCSEEDLNLDDSASDSHQADAAELLAFGRSVDDSYDDDESEIEELECFTITYPITLTLPDGGSQTISSEEELDAFFDDWFSQNPEALDGPEFQFPITVQDTSGADIIVSSEEQFCELIATCYEEYDEYDDDYEDDDYFEEEQCFSLEFPITLLYPDGTATEVTNQEMLDDIYFNEFEGIDSNVTNIPDFQYPINVTLEDGTLQEIMNPKGLDDLFEDCYGGEGLDFEDCFSIQYPVNILFPDGSQITVNNEEEEESSYDDFLSNNPNSENFPEYFFPITISISDGADLTINDAPELNMIYINCIEEGDNYKDEDEDEEEDEDDDEDEDEDED